jgi:hypothetical protein
VDGLHSEDARAIAAIRSAIATRSRNDNSLILAAYSDEGDQIAGRRMLSGGIGGRF